MSALASSRDLRSRFRARLERRRGEIEQTILARAHSISDPVAVGDPEYVTGLRTAVTVAVDYSLEAIDAGDAAAPPIPPQLRAQARQAACNGVPLDTVLRRYVAGHALLGDFIRREAEESHLPAAEQQRLARVQAELFDQLAGAVAAEYEQGLRAKTTSLSQQCSATVVRLLDGELVDSAGLNYDLKGWHLAVAVAGLGAEATLRTRASALDRRLLLVARPESVTWAWLGGRRPLDPDDVRLILTSPWPDCVHVAVGEPACGLVGWRLSHRQATAALPVARRAGQAAVRYADVALIASVLQDTLLAESLRCLYLSPLRGDSDRDSNLCETLRAYLHAGGNVSSTASAVGVSRKTVTARLQAAEERLSRPLNACLAELEVALRLDRLDQAGLSQSE